MEGKSNLHARIEYHTAFREVNKRFLHIATDLDLLMPDLSLDDNVTERNVEDLRNILKLMNELKRKTWELLESITWR